MREIIYVAVAAYALWVLLSTNWSIGEANERLSRLEGAIRLLGLRDPGGDKSPTAKTPQQTIGQQVAAELEKRFSV